MRSLTLFIPIIPPRMSVDEYVAYCKHCVTCMTNHPVLTDPNPALTVVSDHIQALADRQEAVRAGGNCVTQKRDEARDVVDRDMRSLKIYVRGVSESLPSQAEQIILSSGFDIAQKSTRIKPLLHAKRGLISGSAVVETKRVTGPVQYQWQVSDDQSTWSDLPHTFKASTSVNGLAPLKVYWFRFRTLTKTGVSGWSAPVSLIVH